MLLSVRQVNTYRYQTRSSSPCRKVIFKTDMVSGFHDSPSATTHNGNKSVKHGSNASKISRQLGITDHPEATHQPLYRRRQTVTHRSIHVGPRERFVRRYWQVHTTVRRPRDPLPDTLIWTCAAWSLLWFRYVYVTTLCIQQHRLETHWNETANLYYMLKRNCQLVLHFETKLH